LFLAGHTHGGQITMLFPFLHLSPTRFETKYQRGDFHFGSMLMIVTRGLGMSLAPIRYNSTPEVTLIILKNES
jgi:predicted MPP superfamily phosphohydrolase